MADLTLTNAIRTNLDSIQKTGDLVGRATRILSTQPTTRTDAAAHQDAPDQGAPVDIAPPSHQVHDLAARKESIDHSITTLKSALSSAATVGAVLERMRGVLQSAKAADGDKRTSLASEYGHLAQQANTLAQGGDDEFLPATLERLAPAEGDWAGLSSSDFDDAIEKLTGVLTSVHANADALGSNLDVLRASLEFTQSYAEESKEVDAAFLEMTEEGANLLSLQTRQQLSGEPLSFASSQEQSVLALFS